MKQLLIKSLQKALNSYLALDPESSHRIQALQGKAVTVELTGVDLVFHLVFTGNALTLHFGEHAGPSDTRIKGTPLRMLSMVLSRHNRQKFFSDDVSITGNLELGQKIIDLFDELEIDWEEYTSHWVGDNVAYQLGRINKKLKSFRQYVNQTLTQDVNEYVHEEINLFPPSEATRDFFQDVDELRMDVDRLDMKINAIRKQLNAKRGTA